MGFSRCLLRGCVLLFVQVLALRELVNSFTDAGQYYRNVELITKITSFPTSKKAGIIFDRAFSSVVFSKTLSLFFVIAHFAIGCLITVGVLFLLFNLKLDEKLYDKKKTTCLVGLIIGFTFYVFSLGLFSMDYFLSWVQGINFDADMIAYGVPMGLAFIFLKIID